MSTIHYPVIHTVNYLSGELLAATSACIAVAMVMQCTVFMYLLFIFTWGKSFALMYMSFSTYCC